MTSWRDTTSALAQEDLDSLLRAAMPFAQNMLTTHGLLAPFGVQVGPDGAITPTPKLDPELQDGKIHGQDLIHLLVEHLRGERDSPRAVAIVTPVTHKGQEAVFAHLEHSEGATVGVVLPYRKCDGKRGDFEFGKLSTILADQQVWSES